MAEIPPEVAAAQRAADDAWAALRAYRESVDAKRRTDPRMDTRLGPQLRLWTADEDAKYDRLHRAVVAAAEARAAAMVAAGIVSTYDTERDMRTAARTTA